MKYDELLEIVGAAPLFDSSLLRAGDVDPADLASQLSRWVATGKLLQLRRRVYALPAARRRRAPHAFETANLLARPSYVSLEAALSFHGLIPEAVFTTTSITSARPALHRTLLGDFDYRHVSTGLFWGYRSAEVAPGVSALVARPEKALLDLVYLRPRGDDPSFLRELRLERLERLDMTELEAMARRTGKPKLLRAARMIARMATEYAEEYEAL
jgi:predicted transcriptional regulator of viral defense system